MFVYQGTEKRFSAGHEDKYVHRVLKIQPMKFVFAWLSIDNHTLTITQCVLFNKPRRVTMIISVSRRNSAVKCWNILQNEILHISFLLINIF